MWDGELLTIPQVMARTGDPDRRVRERAFRLSLEPYIQLRSELVELFDAMYRVRQEMARNAGFGSFRDYTHREKNGDKLLPADCSIAACKSGVTTDLPS